MAGSRSKRKPGFRLNIPAPAVGTVMCLIWGAVHLLFGGKAISLIAPSPDAAGWILNGWVVEGLFLGAIGLLGGVFANQLAARDETAVRLFKLLGVVLLGLAAWHRMGAPTGTVLQTVYPPLYVIAAAVILVPLYLPASASVETNKKKKRVA